MQEVDIIKIINERQLNHVMLDIGNIYYNSFNKCFPIHSQYNLHQTFKQLLCSSNINEYNLFLMVC